MQVSCTLHLQNASKCIQRCELNQTKLEIINTKFYTIKL